MFVRLLNMRIKMLSREKELFFWGMIFPMFLATFLYLAGVNIPEKLELTHLAVEGTYITKRLIDEQGIHKDIAYFLAIIGLACYITGFTGIKEREGMVVKLSARARRMSLAPIKMSTQFLSGLCANWLVNSGCIVTLIIYIKGILGINLVGDLSGWMMTISLGVMLGLILGMIVGSISKWNRAGRQGILATISVGSGILSGMVDGKLKFYMDYNFPIITKLNPMSFIVDALYTLNVYGMTGRFYMNIFKLIGAILIGMMGLMILQRRNKL